MTTDAPAHRASPLVAADDDPPHLPQRLQGLLHPAELLQLDDQIVDSVLHAVEYSLTVPRPRSADGLRGGRLSIGLGAGLQDRLARAPGLRTLRLLGLELPGCR